MDVYDQLVARDKLKSLALLEENIRNKIAQYNLEMSSIDEENRLILLTGINGEVLSEMQVYSPNTTYSSEDNDNWYSSQNCF